LWCYRLWCDVRCKGVANVQKNLLPLLVSIMLETEVACFSEALTTYRTVYCHNPNNNSCRCNILYIIEEWFCNVCHMCCVCLMFGFDHEIFLLQATGRCATSTKCTSISDIWWFERGHNSCCAGIKHTITKHLCQQIKILFQWQVVKGVLWRNIAFVCFCFFFFFNFFQLWCLQSVLFDHCPWADSCLP